MALYQLPLKIAANQPNVDIHVTANGDLHVSDCVASALDGMPYDGMIHVPASYADEFRSGIDSATRMSATISYDDSHDVADVISLH